MLNVSNAYKQAILSDRRQFKMRCTINSKVYYEDCIQTVNWSGGSISGDTFAIGSTVAADAKITFSRIIEGIAEEQEFKIEIGLILPNNTVEYVSLGIFIVTDFDQKRNDNQTVIQGMDKFIMMEGTYFSKLGYPARIKDVAVEIANLSGIAINRTSFERLSVARIDKMEDYSYRQAIGLIAQFEAGYATFNRQGELEIRQLSDPNYVLSPTNYFSKGLTKNEAMYRINGIQVKTNDQEKALAIGQPTGNQVILENKVMTSGLLANVFQRIKNMNYYPFDLKWQGDPALEAGDWITIIDLKGNRFKVPNLDYSLTFNGGLSAVSSASQQSRAQSAYQPRGSLNQLVDEIKGWISAGGGNWTYEGLETPLNPKEGDTWFKPNGPDMELWRYEKDEEGNLGWVKKVSTTTDPDLLAAIEEAKKAGEEAKLAADDAKQAGEDAKAAAEDAAKVGKDAQAVGNAAKEAADQAVIESAKATQDANTAVGKATESANKADQSQAAANQAKSDAAKAVGDALQAKTDAGKSTEIANQAKVDAAKAVADALKAKEDAGKSTEVANHAKEDAGTAITNALQAKTDAKAALTNADSALKDVAGVKTTLNSEIIRLDSEISAKVTTTAFDSLKGIVTSQGGQISTLSGQVAIKADKTQVDTLTGRVSTAEGSITTNANAIKLKANQTQVDTISGKVTSVEGSLSVQAGKITALNTKTDTNSTQIGKLEANFNGLTSTVSKVQSDLASLDINDRNLLPKSRLETEASGWYHDETIKIEPSSGGGYNYLKVTKLSGTDRTLFGSGWLNIASLNLTIGDYVTLSMNQFTTTGLTTNNTLFVRCYTASNTMIGDVALTTLSNITANPPKRIFATGKLPANTSRIRVFVGFSTINGIIRFNNIKLQKGNKATSWTAAFEDYSTVNQYSELKQTLTEVSTTVTNNKKDADGKITNAQGQISTIAGQVAIKADKTLVDTINNTVSSLQATLTTQAGKITALTSKTDGHDTKIGKLELDYNGLNVTVSNLSSGSENLFVDSRGTKAWSVATATNVVQTQIDELTSPYLKAKKVTMAAGGGGVHNAPKQKLVVGRTYSWSVYVKTNVAGNVTVGCEQGGTKVFPLSTSWQRITHTFVANDNQYRSFVFYRNTQTITELYIHSPVLVEGNISPTWSESLTDTATQSDISVLTQTTKEISATVTNNKKDADGKITNVQGQITTNANAIKLKANQTQVDTISGKVTSVEGSLSVQAGQITALTTKTNTNTTQIGKLETNYNGLTSTVTKVQTDLSNLDINDRNLLPNSRLETEATGWTYDSTVNVILTSDGNGYKYVKLTKLSATTRSLFGSRHVILSDLNLKVGDTLTLSMNQFTTSGMTTSSNLFIRCYNSSNGITGDICVSNIANVGSSVGTKRIFTTGKIPANTVKMAACVALATINSTVRFNNIKLQKGNKATAWSPAMEDYTTVTAFSSLTQRIDTIQATVATKANQADLTILSNQITSVVKEVATKVTDRQYRTNNTSGTYVNQWTKFAETTLSSQYSDAQVGFDIIAVGNGSARPDSGRFYLRHKQQGAMGTATLCELVLTDSSYLNKDDLKAVVVSNTSNSIKVAYYIRIRQTYTRFMITPFNQSGNVAYFETQPFVTAVPTGSQSFTAKEGGSMAGVSTAMSQITQLSNNINLRVSKNDVVNQINISTESILIAGNKVRITGQTTIDSAVIKTAAIADLAVSTGKIANLAVNNAKIADLAVSTAKIGNLAVNSAKIADLAVSTAKIGNLAVSTAKIADLAVTNAKVGNISADKINVGTLNGANVNVTNLNAANLTSGYISSNRIQSKSISADKINANSLSAISANLGTVTAGTLKSITIQSGKFIGGTYEFDGVVSTNTLWMNGRQTTKASMSKYGMFMVTDCLNIYDNSLEDIFMLQIVKHEVAVIHYSPASNTTTYTKLGWSGYQKDSSLQSGSYSGRPKYYAHAKSPTTVNPTDIK